MSMHFEVVTQRRATPHRFSAAFGVLAIVATLGARAANPIDPGWYADPDVAAIGAEYWIYPTSSDKFENQIFFDAFSSPDLVTWKKHEHVIDNSVIKWAKKAMWAPCIVPKDGKYYLFFSANDVHGPELGGIGVAVADSPAGPFIDYLGKPLINDILNRAQPIDQAVFQDPTGQWYIVYGGWRHCNLAKLKPDFTGLVPQADGKICTEITPKGYTEGPMMFFREGKCYFMWSEGGWTGPTYKVAYAMADSVNGPFTRIDSVISPDLTVGTGAGHHSILKIPNKDEYFMVYHRRQPGDTVANHRQVCIDRMTFNADGTIQPVKMTAAGVEARPLKAGN